MTLQEAFELADSIHLMVVDNSNHNINYLTLECLGVYDHDQKGLWAASFDSCIDDDPEWFEHANKYPYSARAATKEEAIEQAAKKVIAAWERGELTGSLADYELNTEMLKTTGH